MNHTERAKEFLEEYCESRFCKKCIHYGLCTLTYDDKFGCTHFKPKSRFVELPCEVGQKVWFINKVGVPDDDYRMSFHYEWVVGETYFHLSMLNVFGKTIFLSREEAEKALKERVME